MKHSASLAVAGLLLSFSALAQNAPAPESAAPAEDPAAALLASLKPQTGAIALPGNLASLNLPATFH